MVVNIKHAGSDAVSCGLGRRGNYRPLGCTPETIIETVAHGETKRQAKMKARGALRAGAIFCHFIIFASAVIVMGLVSSFIDRSPSSPCSSTCSLYSSRCPGRIAAIWPPSAGSSRTCGSPPSSSPRRSGAAPLVQTSSQARLVVQRRRRSRPLHLFWFQLLDLMLEGALFVLTRTSGAPAEHEASAATKERPGTGHTDASAALPATQSPASTGAHDGT
ncbi:hypothetical protein VFPFJ_02163 [Purpureocillium lilacinum]|uniref:Uncharacterized protein n=1 Tax=Purpureocillium lilacinum TaxID=33203 RepID=A0A179HT02_PURLI|nr:hypothetical protein VFPFJ_02163 [Purpureocillium lilacinum]OAQ93002.1 hypothetical protein VFPFJ_02163 [Purpureocillium lilacinum]